MKKVKLFCFPYAGGSASAYNRWKPLLERAIELRPVELAARGRRMREANYASIDGAVDDVYNIICNDLDGPYAFFGHSMGSMIAFELAYKIREKGHPGPLHIFFSGRGAPDMPRHDKKQFHDLPDEQFKKDILELGGTPKEFFEHPELLEVFLPLLKGDFMLTETYCHREREKPLECNITALSGKQDEYTIEDIDAWKKHTALNSDIHFFEGTHFFIHEETQKVMDVVNSAILKEIS
ncbi:MAG: thioesterase [bacterium]|nr:thioesterase [bacterium]